MKIRSKLILLFISLLALLLAVQGFIYYQYNDKVSESLGEAAFSVSKETASIFIYNQDSFYQSKTYAIDENGKVTERLHISPSNRDIQLRLSDDIHDKVIQLSSKDKSFQIPIPRNKVQSTINELKQRNLWITFLLFTIAIIIVIWITYNVTKPLMDLNNAALRISQGDFGAQVDLKPEKYGHDITETVEQFNQMSRQLKNLSQQKEQRQELEHFRELSDISRGLAHNLRNPLNTLQLSLDQLSEQTDPQQTSSRFTNIAIQQVQRIEDWLKNFTLLMEQGIQKESILLKHLIQSALSQVDNDNIELSAIENIELDCVMAEMAMIIQIILQNAIDATLDQYKNEKTPSQKVILSTELTVEHLIILVSDQGKGVNENIKEQLFKPYITDKTYGTGMGLYIAGRLIKHRYQGRIQLEDNHPNGTVAKLWLPLQGNAHE